MAEINIEATENLLILFAVLAISVLLYIFF